MSDPRYPIGKFTPDDAVTPEKRATWIGQIADAPGHVRAAVAGFTDAQLDTPYRDGGWTVRQLVHHLADSHVNAYCRFRLALTEDTPMVKTYEEGDWAKLPDAMTAPVDLSLRLLDGLHARWAILLRALTPAQFDRAVRHPQWGAMPVTWLLQMYAWHGRHHAAHITTLRQQRGW